MVGIVSYGTYIPRYRIRVVDIARVWGKDARSIQAALGVHEKSVPAADEDAVTLAVEAAQYALADTEISKDAIGVLFVGSESHPYAVNPTSTIVGEFIGIGHSYFALDTQFACKAATGGVIAAAGLVYQGKAEFGLVIGSDAAQAKPHDALEYTSAAASVAVVLGKDRCVAELIDSVSYSSDTPDFWRRDGIRFPSHAGRFTGEPAYFEHILHASRTLLSKTGYFPSDVASCVFHMPNGKFPREAAKRLGFDAEQLKYSLTVDHIGNPYAASALLGLASVLDHSRPGDMIFMASYGSGAGSDAFLWRVTENVGGEQSRRKSLGCLVDQYYKSVHHIDYAQYLKQTRKI